MQVGQLCSIGPEGTAPLTAGGTPGAPAVNLGEGVAPDRLALESPSMALDASGRPMVLVDDVLLGMTDQGVVVLGQDWRHVVHRWGRRGHADA